MRQIKFRAFHPKTQKYLIHDWEIGDGDDGYICKDENGELVYSGDLIWEQFTGLLDATGKEIYEGDILYCRDSEKTFYATIYYDAPSFRAKSDLSRNDILIWFDQYEQCSVCGNIHENKA